MKKIISITLAALLTLSLVACGSAEAPAPAEEAPAEEVATEEAATEEAVAEEPAAEPITLNVAYMPNYAALWAVTTADQKGYFAEEGITINLVEFSDGPTEIAAMESGSIDVSYIGPGAHKLCSTGDAQIFLIQQLGDADCVIGFKSKGVEKLEDLKGKKVAYASGTSSETILNLALDSVGLTTDDLELYDMETSNMVTAAVSGSVDAVATWSPYSLKIMSEMGDDAVRFCSNTTFSDVTVTPASWVVNPKYAEEHPDYLVRFTRALYKGMDFGSQEANMEEVAGYVADQCKTELEVAYDQRGDGAWMTKADVVNGINDGTIIGYYTLQQKNFIDSDVVDGSTALPVEDFVLSDIMLEAAN